jgi:peptidoglycan LD-endopeptidase CwlK
MINSRSVDDLHPLVAVKCRDFLAKCAAAGLDVIVTSTYRDGESQDALYAQGRTKPGKRVTDARAGTSFHNWRVAFDVVPLRHGKPVWETTADADLKLWVTVGEIGEGVGLAWSGRWAGKMKEMAHFQFTQGLTISDFLAGRNLI